MFRHILRHPARTLLVVLTLALGLGATTSIVSAIRGVLLDPLPYPHPEQLVRVQEDEGGDTVGFATYEEWKRLRPFASISAVATRTYILLGGGEPEQLKALGITHDTFETFGVRPQLGRDFEPEDDVRGAPRRVLLSDELWTRRFGRDRSVIGRTLRMSDIDFEVIGVMPPRTRIRDEEWRTERVDAWVALRYDTSLPYACRTCRHLAIFARLRDGVSIDQAAREVETMTAALRRAHPSEYPSTAITAAKSLQATIVGPNVASSLWLVLAVVSLVLVAAIANAGSLRLSELFARQNEILVRQSLGATPMRLALMLVAESLLQALAASALGIMFARAGVQWLRAESGAFLPRAADLRLDPAVAGVCIALAVVSGVIIGAIPALRARSWSLRTAGRGVVSGRSRAQKVLVGVNVALSVMLLAGSALLVRSMRNLFSTPVGLDATSVVSFQIEVGTNRYDDEQQLLAMYERFVAESKELPGVSGIALASQLPFAGDRDDAGMTAEDRVGRQSPGDAPDAQRFAVTPDYFATLRIPVLHGRAFTMDDRAESEPVVILSATAARTLWPNEHAIGKRVRIAGGEGNPFRRVVGVVGDVAPGDLGAPKRAQAYLPLSQFLPGAVIGVARTTTGAAALRDVLRRIDPDVAFYGVSSLPSLVRQSEARRTFILACLTSFSMVTLALAMIGLYGVLSLFVSSRTRELGVRMALGSTSARAFSFIVGQGLRLVAVATIIGLAATLLAGRFLTAVLFGVRSSDPSTMAGVAVAFSIVAALACAIPAWRASRISPMRALHED